MPKTKLPAIHTVPANLDPALKRLLESLKEALEVQLGRQGDALDQAVTFRDLIDSGLAIPSYRVNQTVGNPTPSPTPSNTRAPTGFICNSVFTQIMLEWDEHNMGPSYASTEIWRSDGVLLDNAVHRANSYPNVYADAVDYNQQWFYWIRFVSNSNPPVTSPFAGPVNCTTIENIEEVMDELSETLINLPGYGLLIGTTVPNLITTANSAFTHVIKSDDAPTTRDDNSAIQQGDIWIDTNDNNQMYIRNSANNAWVEARDGTLVTTVNGQASTISGHTTSIASNVTNIATVTTANTALTSTVTSLTATVNTKSRTFFQDGIPTSTAIGDLWVDTDDDNKMYRAAIVGADQITAGEWVLARDETNDSYPRVFTQASPPTAINTGDIWFDTDDSNRQYRWNGSSWVAIRDVATQAAVVTEASARASGDTAVASTVTSLTAVVTAKTQTFAQDGIPTSVTTGDLWVDTNDSNKMYRANAAAVDTIVTSGNGWYALPPTTTKTFAQDGVPTSVNIGDLWIDTNDANKMYRANAVGVSAVVTSGNGWYILSDARISSNADAVEVLNTSVGLSGAEATKITALEASIGRVYGARLYTTDTSNNVKVETMANVASSTTTAVHGISAADVTAGVFLSLKNAVATGGLTTQQLNKTFKVTSRINTTQLQIETVGDAATSTVNGNTTVVDGGTIGANAGLAQLATVTADIEGNAHSSYVLQVSANGSVAGMVIEANAEAGGTASAVQFVADKFAIWNGTSSTTVRDFVANSTNVDTTNDTILLDVADYNALYLTTAVTYNNGGGTSIGGLTSGTVYYVIKGTSPKIQLALTESLATAGTEIVLSSTGSGTHTVNNVTSAPFIVSNGNVYIDTVRIKDAAIIGAKIADATIQTAHIIDLAADVITSGTLSASAVIKVGSSGTGATDQRVQIDTGNGARIILVDNTTP